MAAKKTIKKPKQARRKKVEAKSKGLGAKEMAVTLPLFLALADHPAEHLDPREEARRLRQMAADREAEADALEDETETDR